MIDRQGTSLHQLGQHLCDKGVYTVESEIRGVLYAHHDGHLIIFTNSFGDVAIKDNQLDRFIAELQGIREDLEFRKVAKIKGA
jgi:hypothetical protein